MKKLEQTDPRIQLNLEELAEYEPAIEEVQAPKKAPVTFAAAQFKEGRSRTVETSFGKKVVLKDTAGRGFEETSALEEASQNEGFDPFISVSGVFGSSKVEQFKALLDRKKDLVF